MMWGCATSPSPATSSPTPNPTPTTDAPMPSASTSASANAVTPPSGFYRYALHVVSDDCTPAMQNVELDRMMVFAHATTNGLVLNVPLVLQPGAPIARIDLKAEVGGTIRHTTKNAPCPVADVRHTLVVKDVRRTLVVLEETTEQMGAPSCTPPGPKACTTRAEIRLMLEEAKCEATCAATVDMTKKPPEMVCTCP